MFTFAWEEQGERGRENLVTVIFAEEGGKTCVTFRHEPFETIAQRNGHNHGWNSTFDRLDEYLA